jgi:NOL1/NOP2/fmu family ribosome biogenesis protein
VEGFWFTLGENGSFRLWPHKLLGEGHFAAVLRRKGEENPQGALAAGEKLPQQWLSFAKELDIQLPEGKAVSFGQSLYWAPEALPVLQGLKVLRPGLELGEVKKDRLEPAHGLALWLRSCRNVQNLSGVSQEVVAYMGGNVIPSEKKGWCLITVDGYSLGWGKGDGTVLKNHYPKGLRRMG